MLAMICPVEAKILHCTGLLYTAGPAVRGALAGNDLHLDSTELLHCTKLLYNVSCIGQQ